MASPEELASTFRRGQFALRAATIRDTVRVWPTLDLAKPAESYAGWESAMRSLVSRNAELAGRLGTSYVRAAWAEAGTAGGFETATIAPTAEQVVTSLRVTSLVAYRRALGAGLARDAAAQSALVQVSGSVARLVLDAGRGTAAESTTRNGGRWTRVPSASACAFCRMIASRGAVFRSGTNFASHDHCGCSLISQFGAAGPVSFTPSLRNISDADRERVRAWIGANPLAA